MKKTAIICEINPYHNGHRHIFAQARANFGGVVLAVMSGNFVQRGIPSVFDKYTRAALLCEKPHSGGESAADLVVELPFPWCAAGTEAFAMGGVSVARGMGADSLVCGSENGETDYIAAAARARDSVDYLRRVKELEKGSHTRGEGSAVLSDRVMEEFGFSLGANDKLGAEYVRNFGEEGFRAFPRISGAGDVPYKSATDLRRLLWNGDAEGTKPYVPDHAFELYSGCGGDLVKPNRLLELQYVFFRLFYRGEETAEGEGGLLERIRASALGTCSPEEFFKAVRTKKYTDARIRRAMLFAMLGVKREMLKSPPPYTVLLAANGRGREYLSELRKTGTFPVITKPSDAPSDVEPWYAVQKEADRLYTMCTDVVGESDAYMKKHPAITL